MSDESGLVRRLVAGQRAGSHDIDPAPYAALGRAAAYRVQTATLDALEESIGMLKTAVHQDGVGVAAPIYAPRVGRDGFRLPAANVVGIEVEVGLVLGRDLGPEDDARAAVDHFFLGAEICGSRFSDRVAAGQNGGLADNMSALGYVIGGRRAREDQIDGLEVEVRFGGRTLHAAPARHGFGSVLASLEAYARSQHPRYPLRRGTIVTTGSLCGLVPSSGPGAVWCRLGDESVSFEIG